MKKIKHTTSEETTVRELYHLMLDYWNDRDAKLIATLFEKEGNVVGFDGSQINGRKEIEKNMAQIFKDHVTDPYIGKIKGFRFLSKKVAIVQAIAGMVPRGQKGKKRDINPAVNTIHTMVATLSDDGDWYISLFQNTPAKFHGRPDLSKAFTKEIRELLDSMS